MDLRWSEGGRGGQQLQRNRDATGSFPIESEHASPPPPLSFLPLICACDLHLTSDRPLVPKLLLIAATMTAVAVFMPLCRMQHVHLQA